MADAIPQGTRSKQVFEQIFELILSGELPLGGEVNEAALAARFSVSRGPVREAVQRLQGLRLVTREPHMRARVVQLSGRDLVEIFQLRESVEGMACRLAAEAMPEELLAELVRDIERAMDGHALGGGMDIHIRIAKGCRNSRIEHLLCDDLYHLLRIYRLRSGSAPGRRGRANEEHWQIARAMCARDAALAESLMRGHIGRATQNLLDTLDDMDDPLKLGATAA